MVKFARLYIFNFSILILISFPTFADVRNNETCGIKRGFPLTNAYGPYDYTNPRYADKLPRVLKSHFTPIVERLIRGTKNVTPYGDIDYTLRAIPNYHRALYAMSKLQIKDNTLGAHTSKFFTANCYFERAMYFQPKDGVVRMLYGLHLQTVGDFDGALKRYREALVLHPEHPEFNYNIGLLYVEMNNKIKAEKHAVVARNNGYPLNGLQSKINGMK